ncbi:leucyl/phenylalanyl-tRNA--protein transferase [Pseudobacteriovorax antillogorgiicola]|nr:leucyl/phenylalanyl-tRNA--protein transferase [Pseudobacteriovorax antillogorgiicola]
MTTLNKDILLLAYANGFFPMPHPQTEEICWFNPDPRAIIPLERFHLSRSLKRSLRRYQFVPTIDQCFTRVMQECAARQETWINNEIEAAYHELHIAGHAHSLEVWQDNNLVGGLYGVALGRAFFAESKFHRVTDASKAAVYFLTEHLKMQNFQLLEVQFLTPHLSRLGAIEIPASEYQKLLKDAIAQSADFTEFRYQSPWLTKEKP